MLVKLNSNCTETIGDIKKNVAQLVLVTTLKPLMKLEINQICLFYKTFAKIQQQATQFSNFFAQIMSLNSLPFSFQIIFNIMSLTQFTLRYHTYIRLPFCSPFFQFLILIFILIQYENMVGSLVESSRQRPWLYPILGHLWTIFSFVLGCNA